MWATTLLHYMDLLGAKLCCS